MNLDPRLLTEAQRARLALLLSVAAGLAGGGLMVAQAHFLSAIIARAFLEGASLPDLSGTLAVLAAVGAGRALLMWGQRAAGGQASAQIRADLRARLLAHVAALGPTYAAGERSGELAHTATEGIDALDDYFGRYLPQLALAALVPLIVLAVVLPRDALSGVVLLVTAPLIPLFMVLIGRAAEALTRRQYTTLSHLSAFFLDVLQGLPTLRLLNRSRQQVEAIARITERYRQTTMGVLRVAFLSALALEMVGTLSTAVVAVEIGLRLLAGRLAFADALFILVLAPDFYQPLRALGLHFHAGMDGVAAAQRIFEVLETPLPPPAAYPRAIPSWLHVRFENVRVAYEGGARPALDGVTFEIAPGQVVALAGPTGAGKSTVAALLLGFIQPQGGRITIGGVPLADLPADAWRTQVAWVPQRPVLFSGTVAENIALGVPDAPTEAIRQAAALAEADGFIRALPQGYDTPLGEGGHGLSGGEAQRIALARAFLKDAPLVVLDEATAHLDPGIEAQVRAGVERLLEGRTALVVAHRLHTIRRADRVIVLAGGRVVQAGPPGALTTEPGPFCAMLAAQRGSTP